MKSTRLCIVLGFLSAAAVARMPEPLVWDSPSADARGSMPAGNGDIGLNVWVEPSGDLCFFIGKSDAWDENMRLLKLNKVRVRFDPALSTAAGFRQELNLQDGKVVVEDGRLRIGVWVDANHPVIQVDAESVSGRPVACTLALEPWRKEERSLGRNAPGGGGTYFATGFTALPAFSHPDVILPLQQDQIGWYHRNGISPWLPSLQLQKNESIAATRPDPILHLTMGGIVRGDGFVAVSPTEMKTEKPAARLSARVHILGKVTATPEVWVEEISRQADRVEGIPAEERQRSHRRWWAEFWERSWISARGDSRAFRRTPTRGVAGSAPTEAAGSGRDRGRDGGRARAGAGGDRGRRARGTQGPNRNRGEAADLAGGCTVMAWINRPPPNRGGSWTNARAGPPTAWCWTPSPGWRCAGSWGAIS
ncbi:MAG: DUF5703 domain-containing protein [Kiritimatiellia bacterium]